MWEWLGPLKTLNCKVSRQVMDAMVSGLLPWLRTGLCGVGTSKVTASVEGCASARVLCVVLSCFLLREGTRDRELKLPRLPLALLGTLGVVVMFLCLLEVALELPPSLFRLIALIVLLLLCRLIVVWLVVVFF